MVFFLFFIFLFNENLLEKKAVEKILKKDFKGALNIYEELHKINPEKPSVLQNLANLYILLKNEENAKEVLKKLIEIDPYKAYAYKTLRLLLLKEKKEYEWLKISAYWFIKTKSEESLKALIGARVRIKHFSQAKKIMKKNKIYFFEIERANKIKKVKNAIFLITLDTFRYDLITKSLTPNLINLINESYFFKNSYAVTPITLPSHCSIFTGLYPNHTGVKDNSIYKLKDEAETIPEILKKKGYSSYALISSYLLNRKFGLAQGFDVYQDNFKPINKKAHFPSTRRAEDTISEAVNFLKNLKREKAFFFIHLYDTHAPYEPPFPFDEAYPENPYKGEGAYMDFVLGEFFKFLKKAKIYDKSLLIIISDHGESLGENGEPTHGFLLYDPTLHIPFILHLPKQNFKKELEILASQVDLFPTLFSILKIKHKKVDGKDLFNIESERKIFSETELPLSFNWSPLFKVYKGDYSYISKPSDKLFWKKKNFFNEKIKKELEREIEKYKNEKPFWRVEEEILDEEIIKNLKSLGYHQSFIKTKNVDFLPDPEEKMQSLVLYQKAISYEEDKNFSELIKTIKEILKREGDNVQILSFCSEWYYKAGKEKEAIDLIEKAIKLDKDFSQAWFYYGFLIEKKDKEKAKSFYEKALVLEPKHFLARYNLSRLYLIEKEFEKAEREMNWILKIIPNHPYTLNNLGYLYYERDRDCKKAKIFIEKAYNLKKEDEYLRLSYASVLCNCGEREKGREILKNFTSNSMEFERVLNLCK